MRWASTDKSGVAIRPVFAGTVMASRPVYHFVAEFLIFQLVT